MARGKKLDLEFSSWDDTWEADNKIKSLPDSSEPIPPNQHTLVFQSQKRRGKVVTLVGEFYLSKDDATALLKRIKKRLGSGGTMKEGWMELQGEQQTALKEVLETEGFRFKR